MQPNVCAIRKVKDDMTAPQQPGSASGVDREKPQSKNELPPEILAIIGPALQTGTLSGMSGLLVGGFAGIMRSSTPILFALASGIQWFTLGTTFSASRGFVLHAWGNDKVTSREKVSASAIAGGVSGTCGGLLRGRANIIPGAIMFAIFGATGQVLYNKAESRKAKVEAEGESPQNSWLKSKWNPMTKLSDEEYEEKLQEMKLQVEAEIALIDESIAALRVQEQEVAVDQSTEDNSSQPK